MNESQQQHVVGTLQLGCPLDTAVELAGIEQQSLQDEMLANPAFARRVLQARATPEIRHMESIRKAADDVKNWRASVWWLERVMPDRYGRRAPNTVPEADFEKFVAELIELVSSEVRDHRDHDRLVARIRGLEARKKVSAAESEPETDEAS
ncbi:hypothetical protein [Aeoliella mucimassa]|uniref:Uncharacterized protein n=1 Tax=Aeoliella mucimassa TaxID=2527972 RepID=A0A518AHW2_9BACT|nr:hypothetical protein [Aeoliella mucimassa]QDU54317.1 hypothetical protein Pan181_04980 [Aeoliella mucimassa]